MKAGNFKMGPKEWDAAAETYARHREPLTLPYGLDALTALRLEPGERLLDLAAGTGGVALAAARGGAEVVAGDWSPGMVSCLAARAKDEGVDGVSARVLDGQNLDLPGDHFDAACSVFGLMFFSDHRAGLAELSRVLKPGGRVAIAVWENPTRMGHLALWERAARAIDPDIASFPRPAAWEQMDTASGLRRELEGAGFGSVSVAPVSHRWEVPSAQWFIEHADASQAFTERLGAGSTERLREAVLTRLWTEHGDGPFTLTTHAHLGTATK